MALNRRPGLSRQVGWAVRRPRAAIEVVRTRPLWLAMMVGATLPMTVRGAVARPVAGVAARAVRRPGDHPVAAPCLLAATAVLDGASGVRTVGPRVAVDASPRTATRLARIALAVDEPTIAEELLAAHTAALADDPSSAGLRGELALRSGRYGEAATLLDLARRRRPRDPAIRRAAARARGELAMLDTAWRPALPTPRAARAAVPGRVLHVLTNSLPYRPAGYAVRAQQVARCQQAVGLDPMMVTRAGFPGTDGAVTAPILDDLEGVIYHRLEPGLPPGLPVDDVAQRTAVGLARLAEDLRPAVLQPTTNHVNGQVALAVGEHLGIPVIYEVRGFLEETWRSRMGEGVVAGDRYRGARAVETDCMRRAQAVVTLSETMRAEILARGDIEPDRVVVIPNAVDVDRFVPGPRDDVLAAELGIAPDETVVGYISSLTTYEGIPVLVEAVASLRRRGRRVRLLLVGDGDARREIEAAITRTGLARDGGAILTGRVPHGAIVRYYRTIDIFVVPRTADRVSQLVTPLKPYEALAMARPTVVSDVPALREIIDDGVTGRTFPAGDAARLAEVLGELMDDPAERARLGSAAREWVAAERTWRQNGHRYLALYQRLGVA